MNFITPAINNATCPAYPLFHQVTQSLPAKTVSKAVALFYNFQDSLTKIPEIATQKTAIAAPFLFNSTGSPIMTAINNATSPVQVLPSLLLNYTINTSSKLLSQNLNSSLEPIKNKTIEVTAHVFSSFLKMDSTAILSGLAITAATLYAMRHLVQSKPKESVLEPINPTTTFILTKSTEETPTSNVEETDLPKQSVSFQEKPISAGKRLLNIAHFAGLAMVRLVKSAFMLLDPRFYGSLFLTRKYQSDWMDLNRQAYNKAFSLKKSADL